MKKVFLAALVCGVAQTGWAYDESEPDSIALNELGEVVVKAVKAQKHAPFAVSRIGSLTDAAAQAMKEQNIDFEIKPVVCDGIEACRMALLKLNKGILDGNFIEGMACIGGCIGGAGCLTHGEKNKAEVDKYGREAHEKNISDAISLLK